MARRWKALLAKGAQPQRLLWASTSTKNKRIATSSTWKNSSARKPVDTIPPATFDCLPRNGKLRNSLTENVRRRAKKTMDDLAKAGISMKEVTEKLVLDGVKLFADAFVKLLDATGKSAGVKA